MTAVNYAEMLVEAKKCLDVVDSYGTDYEGATVLLHLGEAWIGLAAEVRLGMTLTKEQVNRSIRE